MDSRRKIYLILGVVAFMLLMVWLFSSGEKPATQAKRSPYVSSNWNKRFQLYDKNPLGLYLFDELLRTHIDTANRVMIVDEWSSIDTSEKFVETPKTFVFVGNVFGLHDEEMDSLMEHVDNGSTLFLSYNNLTENLFEYLFYDFLMEFDYTDQVNVFSEAGKFSMVNIFQNDTIATIWQGFNEVEGWEEHNVLSSFMELDNFVEMQYGEGRILVHTNPNMFYNYQLKRPDGFEYCAFVLDQLDKDQDVYYLELGRMSDDFGNYDVEDEGAEGKEDESFLRLIFTNRVFLIALLLSLMGAIMFVIFRSKRTRPIVPYVVPKKDMTLAFTETITSIYYAKRNPYGILNLMRKNFFSAVQRYFFIDLSKRNGDKEIIMLAEKTNTSVKELNELIAMMETKEAFGVSDQYVAEVQKRQHRFYKKTGIIADKLSKVVSDREIVFRRSLLLPILMIFAGAVIIILGLYYLTAALGIGVILWPLGMILLVLGVLRLSKPYMIIDGKKIIYFSSVGGKKEFLKGDILGTEIMKGGVLIRFTNDRSLTINYWDLSYFDKMQFERFISKLEK